MYLEHYDSRYDPPAPIIKVQVASYIEGTTSVTLSAFLDTGSDGTMVPLRVLETIQAEYQESKYLRGVTGQR